VQPKPHNPHPQIAELGDKMKKLFVLMIIISAVFLQAVKTDIKIKDTEVTLNLENIKIKDIEYVSGKTLTVIHGKKERVELSFEEKQVNITAPALTKVKLKLPASKTYTFPMEDGKFVFTENLATIHGNDGEIVQFSQDGLYIKDNDEEVRIGKNGIYVDSEEEKVQINSTGIIVENEDSDENETITNMWGQMLGGFIGFIAKASMSFLGDDSAKVAEYILNDEIDGGSSAVHLNFNSDDDGEPKEKVTTTTTETYGVSQGTSLTVININGNIDIFRADDDAITLEAIQTTNYGEKAMKNCVIDVTDSKNFKIETIHKTKNTRVSTSYKIYVPDMVKLESLTSSNGNIKVEGQKGDAIFKTSNGSVNVTMFNGSLGVKTSNGKIQIDGVTGVTDLKTSNAKIIVKNSPMLESARTSNGSVSVEMASLANDLEIDTSNSSVAVYLPKNADATVSGETSNGSIKTFDLEFSNFEQRNNKFSGELGKGTHEVTISTSNGSIKIYETETWR